VLPVLQCGDCDFVSERKTSTTSHYLNLYTPRPRPQFPVDLLHWPEQSLRPYFAEKIVPIRPVIERWAIHNHTSWFDQHQVAFRVDSSTVTATIEAARKRDCSCFGKRTVRSVAWQLMVGCIREPYRNVANNSTATALLHPAIAACRRRIATSLWAADGIVPSRFIATAKLEACLNDEQSFWFD
jgi:hypothetical protein